VRVEYSALSITANLPHKTNRGEVPDAPLIMAGEDLLRASRSSEPHTKGGHFQVCLPSRTCRSMLHARARQPCATFQPEHLQQHACTDFYLIDYFVGTQ